MKRDWDLIRTILLQLEKTPSCQELRCSDFPEEDSSVVNYHIGLLVDANLVKAISMSSMDGKYYLLQEMTWQGHELLDSIKNDSVWSKVKEETVKKSSGLSLEIIKGLAIKFAADLFSLGS